MKKIIQMTILLLFAATSVTMANESLPSISLKNIPAEKKFSLSIDRLKENVEIILTDINGVVLLSQETEGEKTFAKVFNLKELPSGEYFLTVRTSLSETVQPISLTETEVLVNPSKKREFFNPVINVHPGHIDVSLFNGLLGDVTVNILDDHDESFFRENLKNVLLVEKRYSLDKLPRGAYAIEVVTPRKTFYKAFTVR